MAVRIKTIPNGIQGKNNRPERHATTHKPQKASDMSGQSNKILELEWEALGRKLHKQHDGAELEKLRRQLKEKDEQLRQANDRIVTLKKQLYSLQEKQRINKIQATNKNGGQIKKVNQPFHRGSHKNTSLE